MQRKASAVWKGGLKDGKGAVSSSSGVLNNTPYSFSTRFENTPGTNPEELIAAAHAGCFSMALIRPVGRCQSDGIQHRDHRHTHHGKTRFWLDDHCGSSGCGWPRTQCRSSYFPEGGRERQERLSGVKGAQGQHHHDREARRLGSSRLRALGFRLQSLGLSP